MAEIGNIKAVISLSDLLTPQLAKANNDLEKFAQKLTGIDAPLGKLGSQLQRYSSVGTKMREGLQLEVKLLSGLAAAYTKGASAVEKYTVVMKVEEALAKANISINDMQGRTIATLIQQREALGAAIEKERAAQAAATLAAANATKQYTAEGSELRASLMAEIAAYKQGEQAVAEYAMQQRVAANQSSVNVQANGLQGQSIDRLTRELAAEKAAYEVTTAAAQKAAEQKKRNAQLANELRASLKIENEQLGGLLVAYRQGAEAVAKYNTQIRIENELRRVGVSGSSPKGMAIARDIEENDRLTAAINKQRDAVNQIGTAKTSLLQKVNSLRFGYFALSAAVGVSISSFIDAQRQLERMQNTFLAATGSARQGAAEMAFVREQANKLGLDFRTVGQEYAKFAAATKGTSLAGEEARKIFIAVSTASTALGLSAEQSAGALNALQQMVSKTTVQSEELRGQLSERIPGSFAAAAKAMGMTEVAFNKQIEKGNILARDLLPRLAEAWMTTFGPAAATGAALLNAEINRLKTSVFDLLSSTAQSADLAGITREFSNLTESVIKLGEVGPHTAGVVANLGSSLTSLLGILDSTTKSFGVLITLLSGAKAGSIGESMRSALDPIFLLAKTLGTVDYLFNRMVTNNDQLIARSTQAAKELAEAEFQKVLKATNSMGAAYKAGIRVLQAEIEKANALVLKQAPTGPSHMDKGQEKALALSAAIQASFKKLQKTGDDLVDTWGDNEKAVKAYDARLAHLLKLADPYGEITRDLTADMKSLNEMYANGDITNYDSAMASLNEEATKSRLAFFNASKEGKEWAKALKEAHKEIDAVESSLTKASKAATKWMDNQDAAKADTERAIQLLEDQVYLEAQMNVARHTSAAAVREVSREMFIQNEIVQNMDKALVKGTAAYNDFIARMRSAAGALFDAQHDDDALNEQIQQWNQVADIIGSIDGDLGKVAQSMVQLGVAIKGIQTAAKGGTASFESWAGAITAAVSILKESGLVAGPGGGTSQFGGAMSGTYSAEGAAVGAIVGAAIAAAFTAGAGTAAGAAIGSAIGEVLGSLIKKGADEGLVTIQAIGTATGIYFQAAITGINNKLGRNLQDAAQQMIESLQDIVTSIGGELTGIGAIDIKVRDDIVTVFVNGIKKQFKEMQDAMSFAIAELLKTADMRGVDEMLRSALQGTSAQSLEALQGDLQAIQKIIDFGFTNSQQAIRGFENELDTLANTLVRTVGNTEQLARGMSNLATEEIRRWQSTRDAITGDKMSNAQKLELLKQDAVMWNAEKALRIAELEAKKADLIAQAKMVQVGVDIRATGTDAELRIYQTQLDGYSAFNGFMAKAVQATAGIVMTGVALIDAQLVAIQQVIDALANMPDIDIPSLNLPHTGGGGGNSGPSRADQIASAFGVLGLASVELEGRMKALTDALKYLQHQGAISAAQMQELGNQLFVDILGQMASAIQDEQTLHDLEEIRYDIQKANWLIEIERLKAIGAINQEQYDRLLAYLNALPPNLPNAGDTLTGADLLAQVEDAINGLNLPLEGLRDNFEEQAAMIDKVRFGMEQGIISAERYAQIMGEMGQQAQLSLGGMAADILAAMGKDKEAAKMRYDMSKIEFTIKLAEFKLTMDHLFAIQAIDAALYQQMLILWREASQFEWPAFVFDDPNANGGNDNTDSGLSDILGDLRAAIDRLRNAINNLREFQEGLNQSDLSPLTVAQQFADAQAHYQEVLAAAMAGDLGAIEDLPDAAQQFLQLASQMFGTAGMGYQGIFNMVNDQISQIIANGQDVLDALPSQFQPIVDGLDTIAEILNGIEWALLNPGSFGDDNNDPGGLVPPWAGGGAGGGKNATFGAAMGDLGNGLGTDPATATAVALHSIDRRLSKVVDHTKMQNVLTFEHTRQAASIANKRTDNGRGINNGRISRGRGA